MHHSISSACRVLGVSSSAPVYNHPVEGKEHTTNNGIYLPPIVTGPYIAPVPQDDDWKIYGDPAMHVITNCSEKVCRNPLDRLSTAASGDASSINLQQTYVPYMPKEPFSQYIPPLPPSDGLSTKGLVTTSNDFCEPQPLPNTDMTSLPLFNEASGMYIPPLPDAQEALEVNGERESIKTYLPPQPDEWNQSTDVANEGLCPKTAAKRFVYRPKSPLQSDHIFQNTSDTYSQTNASNVTLDMPFSETAGSVTLSGEENELPPAAKNKLYLPPIPDVFELSHPEQLHKIPIDTKLHISVPNESLANQSYIQSPRQSYEAELCADLDVLLPSSKLPSVHCRRSSVHQEALNGNAAEARCNDIYKWLIDQPMALLDKSEVDGVVPSETSEPPECTDKAPLSEEKCLPGINGHQSHNARRCVVGKEDHPTAPLSHDGCSSPSLHAISSVDLNSVWASASTSSAGAYFSLYSPKVPLPTKVQPVEAPAQESQKCTDTSGFVNCMSALPAVHALEDCSNEVVSVTARVIQLRMLLLAAIDPALAGSLDTLTARAMKEHVFYLNNEIVRLTQAVETVSQLREANKYQQLLASLNQPQPSHGTCDSTNNQSAGPAPDLLAGTCATDVTRGYGVNNVDVQIRGPGVPSPVHPEEKRRDQINTVKSVSFTDLI